MKKRVFFDSEESFYTIVEDDNKVIVVYTYDYSPKNNTGNWIDMEGSREEAAAWIMNMRRGKEC